MCVNTTGLLIMGKYFLIVTLPSNFHQPWIIFAEVINFSN